MESKSFEKDNLREALHDVVDEMDRRESTRTTTRRYRQKVYPKIETKSMSFDRDKIPSKVSIHKGNKWKQSIQVHSSSMIDLMTHKGLI